MTWKIATWCPSSRTGTVSAPDVAKLCFGPPENPLDVDFEVDTEVLVTLDRDGRDWILRSVVPRFAPQPAGTLSEVFAPLNGRFHGDLCVEAQTHDALSLVAYDCCAWCGPATRVFFEGVSSVVGLDDELDLSCARRSAHVRRGRSPTWSCSGPPPPSLQESRCRWCSGRSCRPCTRSRWAPSRRIRSCLRGSAPRSCRSPVPRRRCTTAA